MQPLTLGKVAVRCGILAVVLFVVVVIALKFGANDLGSIMIEENVVSQAGTTFRMGVADMQRLIRDLGYEPHQRDNWYRLLN